ncbi:MAG: FecR domain-containing protein [Ignavibacteria bacterium]|jgi:ferric-dicitrate binding protein FerR (iron transport regulator)
MNKKQLSELSVKNFTGNITDKEKRLLNEYLAGSESNRKEYEKIKKIWMKTAPAIPSRMPDVEDEWEYLLLKIESSEGSPDETNLYEKMKTSFGNIFSPGWKPALAGALTVILIIAGIFIFNRDLPSPVLKTEYTSNAQYKNILFPDGSTAYLNSGSSIEFPDRFNEEIRRVTLKGEAFFSVSKDSRPFIVETGNAKITVLGTKFNVWSRYDETRVIVKEGLVNLAPGKNETEGINLSRNQFSIIPKDSGPTPVKEVNPDNLIGWIEGELVFNRTSLVEIAAEIERHYDVVLSLESDSLKELTLTGSFKNQNVDSVLTMICLALELEVEKSEEGYIINFKKDN